MPGCTILQLRMAIFGSSASRTPVRVVPVNSVNNFCRVCNINLVISGIGKFNLFDIVAAKLSSDSVGISRQQRNHRFARIVLEM